MSPILIVEDDPSLAKFWSRFLKNLACGDYRIVRSPREALETLETFKPQILVTDLSMPGMNGMELILKVHRTLPETKMVITSGFINDTRPFADAGIFVHVIKKPYIKLEYLKEFFELLLRDANEVSSARFHESDGVYYWDL